MAEIGPRIKMRLYKIEEGLLQGNVMYNRVVVKNPVEREAQRKKIMEKRREKERRRMEYERRVDEKRMKQ